jgi:hypothetical protein
MKNFRDLQLQQKNTEIESQIHLMTLLQINFLEKLYP